MKEYRVEIERKGRRVPVGTISGEDTVSARFRYLDSYLEDPDAAPVSVSLPLQGDAFSPSQTRNYFEGLLPEGFTRHSVAGWMHIDEDDYLSILYGLGRECIGALCITGDEDNAAEAYEKISSEDVKRLAAEGATTSAELVTKAHLSLTGASGKVGLYYDSRENSWYLPAGSAPSTHIVKQSHIRLDSIVTNEQLCMMTAGRCGIPVPQTFIINTGSARDEEVLFASERYDRSFGEDPDLISGLPRPFRLHQEDFGQALGIPAVRKYENEPQRYLRRMFDLLRKYSSDPIRDQLTLWDCIVFDYLIGNTDSHVKNFSLLYSADLHSLRLAPVYDILSTAVYESSTRDMAFYIGDKITLDEITADSFRMAAAEAGLGGKMAMRRMEEMCSVFEAALRESTERLSEQGFVRAEELAERIRQNGGVRYLC